MCQRLAPTLRRTAISRVREVDCTKKGEVMLKQAINTTQASNTVAKMLA